LTFRLPEAGR